ncbi:hypothetical protein GQ457_04G015900 [Hibiscus cannabinus]
MWDPLPTWQFTMIIVSNTEIAAARPTPTLSFALASLLSQSQRLPTIDRLLVRLEPKTSPFNNHPKSKLSPIELPLTLREQADQDKRQSWGRTGCIPVKNNYPRGRLLQF